MAVQHRGATETLAFVLGPFSHPHTYFAFATYIDEIDSTDQISAIESA